MEQGFAKADPPQDDQTLVQRVRVALSASEHVYLRRVEIDVTVRDSIVRLTGVMDSLAGKRRAEEVARRVPGVRAVASELRLIPVVLKTDREIAKSARHYLDTDRGIDARGVKVAVRQGVVTLKGSIPSQMQRRLAAATLWWLPAVRDVVDELTVVYPEEDSDTELAAACRTILERDRLVDAGDVSVTARAGTVTLAGSVGSAAARDAAENTVWGVEGVRDVQNRLAVAPEMMPSRERELGL